MTKVRERLLKKSMIVFVKSDLGATIKMLIHSVLSRVVTENVDGIQHLNGYRTEWNPSGLNSGAHMPRQKEESGRRQQFCRGEET